MQTGIVLQDLAKEIRRVEQVKRDFVAPSSRLSMEAAPGGMRFVIDTDPQHEDFGITRLAHSQVSDWTGIPRKYYERMQVEAPELLARNVNTWLEQSDKRRMVRTLDGNMRAFLSDRYRPLDNMLVAQAALPVLSSDPSLEVRSCALTETRLYIQAVTHKLEAEVKPGDVVRAGLVISNSEVGCGSVRVEPLIFRLVCLNGLVTSSALKRYHVGRRIGGNGEKVQEDFYRSETIQADNRAFLMKIRDTVQHALDEPAFLGEVEKLRGAAARVLPAKSIQNVVEEVTRRLDLSETEGVGVLEALIAGAELTQWGLASAVTAQAHTAQDYDRSVELERAGHEVVEFSPAEWQQLVA